MRDVDIFFAMMFFVLIFFVFLQRKKNRTDMGYSVTFRPNEEAASKIKPWNWGKRDGLCKDMYNSDDYKTELLLYCMGHHSVEDTWKVMKELKLKLKVLGSYLWDEYKWNAYGEIEKEGEITLCGWKYRDFTPDVEEDEIYQRAVEYLSLKSVIVETPDYFGEQENFLAKVKDIKDDIEWFSESITELHDYRMIEMFRDFKVCDDDYDELDGGAFSDISDDGTGEGGCDE